MSYEQLRAMSATGETPSQPPSPDASGQLTSGSRGKRPRRVRQAFRYRILPRTVLGVSTLILSFAVGAGFSGVVLYSYYQYRLNQTDTRVNALVTGYKSEFAKAQADLAATAAAAKATIAQQLQAVQQSQGSPALLAGLTKQLAPSVFFVHTLDANGQPSVGTAFVVSSNANQSLLLTSYTTVEAATHAPGPPVYVQQGSTQTAVTVRSWDPTYDLALLILPEGNLPSITAAATSPSPVPGDHFYVVSGLGTAGASIANAEVVDVSANGLAVDSAIGTAFQGAPIVDQTGEVVAVASRTYSPLGFTTSGIWYTPYVEAACNKVLSCPGGTLVGSH